MEKKFIHDSLGVLFIFIGVASYITPIPGSTFLIILGLVFLIGKKKTILFLKKILKKNYDYLKLKYFFSKIKNL